MRRWPEGGGTAADGEGAQGSGVKRKGISPLPTDVWARNNSSRQGTVQTAEWHIGNGKLEIMT
jgi:hypothetical protein